ncbi:MAG: hypothetical protein OXN89_23260 [Bryobacterales bacterium]|nr:hypothetical protein [Bryobacterales bacterium]
MNPGQEALLSAAQRKLAPANLPAKIKAAALERLADWLTIDKFAGLSDPWDYAPLLRWMVETGDADLLADSFYQTIPFGTGGRRGPVGIGPNRINPYTVASSVQGHVQYLRERYPGEGQLRVVVACDVRAFHDLRGTYPRDVPNPVLGMSSRDFAHIATDVYTDAGVEVWALPDSSGEYVSTPELSFLIRRLEAHGGINVSASHNHPDDNGSKFYNAEGGQEIPPDDEALACIVEEIREVRAPSNDRETAGRVREIPGSERQAYIDMNVALGSGKRPSGAKVVFTGLHGTGIHTAGRCLEGMGFRENRDLFYVKPQCEFRSDFRNVTFRSPNPEVPEALQMGIDLAGQERADLVLATDPDADRLGGASRDGTKYAFLSGNEIASILTRFRLDALEASGRLPARPLAIKTVVTTDLIRRLVESRGGVVIGDLLVGFKYIAAVLGSLERTGRYKEVRASIDDFVVAAEESHGFMLTPTLRDKDAAGAAVALADLACDLGQRGETVHDYLIDTYKRYGYHANTVRSTVMQGAAGAANIREVQRLLRSDPPTRVAGRRVERVNDYWDEGLHGPFLSETDRSSRNLISFRFEGGINATIRPSGTEPKNKVYLELGADPLGPDTSDGEFREHRAAVDREVKAFSNRFLSWMLELIDVSVPDYAFEISDLVPLHHKVDFCSRFLPEFERRATALAAGSGSPSGLAEWVEQRLAPYGPDARMLVRRAFDAYLSERSGPQTAGILESAFYGAAGERPLAR